MDILTGLPPGSKTETHNVTKLVQPPSILVLWLETLTWHAEVLRAKSIATTSIDLILMVFAWLGLGFSTRLKNKLSAHYPRYIIIQNAAHGLHDKGSVNMRALTGLFWMLFVTQVTNQKAGILVAWPMMTNCRWPLLPPSCRLPRWWTGKTRTQIILSLVKYDALVLVQVPRPLSSAQTKWWTLKSWRQPTHP